MQLARQHGKVVGSSQLAVLFSAHVCQALRLSTLTARVARGLDLGRLRDANTVSEITGPARTSDLTHRPPSSIACQANGALVRELRVSAVPCGAGLRGTVVTKEPALTQEPFDTSEETRRDRREHGGASQRPDDDELASRTEQERLEAGLEDYDPNDVPPATDPLPEELTESE